MGNKLINIRGTNGSGKSTLMRKFMGDNPKVETFEIGGRKVKYLDCGGRYIIGDYTRDCGGLDTLKTMDEIRTMAREFISKGDVMMEGMMFSTIFSSSIDLDKELTDLGHKYYWVQIDIPVEVCINSTVIRRISNANFDSFDPKLLVRKWRSIGTAYNKALDEGRLTFSGSREECEVAIRYIFKGNDALFVNRPKVNTDVDLNGHPEIKVTKQMINDHLPKAENNIFGFME